MQCDWVDILIYLVLLIWGFIVWSLVYILGLQMIIMQILRRITLVASGSIGLHFGDGWFLSDGNFTDFGTHQSDIWVS